MAAQKLLLFPTLLWKETVLDGARGRRLLRELHREAYQIAERDEEGRKWCASHYPGGYTSYGSWSRLFDVSSTFAELRTILDTSAARFARASRMKLARGEMQMVSLWVNILKSGGSHSLHLHPLSTISGTVYLSTPRKGGSFKVEDPRLSKMMAAPPREETGPEGGAPGSFYRVRPRAGEALLFESWLRHEVEAHYDGEDRVSVSFNYNWF